MSTQSEIKRILLVEDSPIVSDATEQMLQDLGYVVIGPANTMATALEVSQSEEIDIAIVDINIRGAKAYSVLKILDARQIPFILTSGYAGWDLPVEWLGRPRLLKPYSPELLAAAINSLANAK